MEYDANHTLLSIKGIIIPWRNYMKRRTITGIIMAIVIIPCVYFGGIPFLVLALFIAGMGGYEMMHMFYKSYPTLKWMRYVVPVMCVIIVFLMYLAATKGFGSDIFTIDVANGALEGTDGEMTFAAIRSKLLYNFWILTGFAICIVICFSATLFIKGSGAKDMMACATTLCYCGLIMGLAASIEYLQPISASPLLPQAPFGGRSFAYVFLIVTATDIFAYLVGRKLGKHKLCPDISPKKSVEGAIAGGLIGGALGTAGAYLFRLVYIVPEFGVFYNILLVLLVFVVSVIISVMGQLGDLIASKFKRTYEIKDYSHIFPGHGGVLDRFDSLMIAGSAFYIIVQFIQLILLRA